MIMLSRSSFSRFFLSFAVLTFFNVCGSNGVCIRYSSVFVLRNIRNLYCIKFNFFSFPLFKFLNVLIKIKRGKKGSKSKSLLLY